MLQKNLIYGIQKKIRENKASHKAMAPLEESTALVNEAGEEHAEVILEGSFIGAIYDKVTKTQKKEETRSTLVTEAFSLRKAEKKLSKDIAYFTYLYENFVDDNSKDAYRELLESIFEDTIKLYKETDLTPRLVSLAVDSNELTESMVVDIYRNKLNQTIKEKYTKPLLSGKITELYENELKTITRKFIEEGASIDIEKVKIYMPFEETLYQFNRSVLIPETAQRKLELVLESTPEEFKALLEETAEDVLARIEKKIRLLTSLVAPKMFKQAVETDEVDAPKMAGVSIVIDKNFDEGNDGDCDEDDICPDEVAAVDPEAAEELADDAEAEAIDDVNSDIVSAENAARKEQELATDSDDYEGEEAEEEAEESPAEETAEHPEQPGAIELDLELEEPNLDEKGAATNKSDLALSEPKGDEAAEEASEDAELPGEVPNVGEDVEPDGDEDDIEGKDDVSEEIPEEEEDIELVEGKAK
jgi:hypothetical protein